jgi:hypothetical protein
MVRMAAPRKFFVSLMFAADVAKMAVRPALLMMLFRPFRGLLVGFFLCRHAAHLDPEKILS